MSNIERFKCKPGYYKMWSVSQIDCLPCPEGSFNEYYGMKSKSDCQPCIAGRVCKKEGLSSPNYNLKDDSVVNCSKGDFKYFPF